MKHLILSTLFLIVNYSVYSQLKELTLEDAILKRRTTFEPEHLNALQWTKKEGVYSFVANNTLVLTNSENLNSDSVVNISTLNDLLKNDEPLLSFPAIEWLSENNFSFHHENVIWIYDIQKKQLAKAVEYEETSTNHDFGKKTLKLAFTRENNLFVVDSKTTSQITSDGGNGIINGHAVHRFEFGIIKGTFWSPHENFLAFYRKDESMVTDYPLVDISTKPASLNNIKYPMAGDRSHHVTVGVYDTKTKKTTFLKTGEPKEQYLTNVTWSPDEKSIYIAIVNRDQNYLKFNQYDVVTGELIKTLFEEKDNEYVQPLNAMFWLKGSTQFVWTSRRDGFKQLYLYNADGSLVRKLTETDWDVQQILGQQTNGDLVFTGNNKSGLETHAYSVNLNTGKVSTITKSKGTHHIQLNESGAWILDEYNSLEVAGTTQLIKLSDNSTKELVKAKNPLAEYAISPPELLIIKAADNSTDLNCRVFKPSDFDKTKKYPVLVYVYNGPGVQLITNSYNADAPLWMNYFANKGYIVFTVDGRGSSNRGEAFEQVTFRQLGTIEIDDQLAGVEYLKSLPYVNSDKMAVHGWSYGGFMTTSLMLRSPETFKVGVAGGPVIDWKYYEIMYTERYMDTPEQNPDGYAKSSLLDKTNNLQGKLLMIHGAVDDVVVWQHSLDFAKSCIDEGVQIDYFMYPGHPHNVRGKDRVHLMTKVLGYIENELNR